MTNETAELRHTAKDSVFRDLFSNPKYLLQLYQTLHPEDKMTTEADLTIETLERLLYNGQYNDLGFAVKDQLLVLVEAQSSWSMNILIRCFLYLAQTYHNYFTERNINLLKDSIKAQLPKPELYVIYCGERGERPDILSMQKELFNGRDCCLEVKVKIIYADGSHSIIDQYIQFCRVLNEQVKIYGRTRKAIEETFRICMDRDILKEYLQKHESEAVSIMMTLFSQERIDQFKYNEALAEGIGIGEARGEARGEAKGTLYTLASLVRNNLLAKDVAASQLGISVEEFDKRVAVNC